MEFNYLELINNVGFPIVVALWFMMRTEKVIKANTEALNDIKEIMGRCRING